MSLGNNIRKYRNINQLRQVDLAKMIGKSTRMLQKYEANEVTPSLELIKEIAAILNVSVYDLLEKDPTQTPTHTLIQKLIEMTVNETIFWNWVHSDQEPGDKYSDLESLMSWYHVEELEYFTNTSDFLATSINGDLYILIVGGTIEEPFQDLYLVHADEIPFEMENGECAHHNFEVIAKSHEYNNLFGLHKLVNSLVKYWKEDDARVSEMVKRLKDFEKKPKSS